VAVVTGLAPDPRRPGYRHIDVDRGRFASLPEWTLEPLRLTVGSSLSPAMLARLHALADIEAASRAAERALARRPYARRDLQRRLLRKQHPPEAVEAALERLAHQGILDDRRFAEHFVAVQGARGRGPVRLLRDLGAQGVDRETAERAVRAGTMADGLDGVDAIRRLASRRTAQLSGLPFEVARRRLLAYLARRGYRGALVRELVEEVISGSRTD
jgi:regulatory protein